MKTLSVLLLTLLCAISTIAQPWLGNVPGSIYYNQGNVGIGTTAPGYKLDVNGTFQAGGVFIVDAVGLTHWGGSSQGIMTWDTGYASIYGSSGNILKLGSNGAQGTMTINNGNVGIGTTTPGYKLEIKTPSLGAGDYGLKVTAGYTASDNVVYFTGNDGIAVQTMVMKQNGNVGIGTTNPLAKLDIAGAANVFSRFDVTANRGVLRMVNNSMGLGNTADLGIDFNPSTAVSKPYAGIYSGWQESTSDGFLSFKTSNDGGTTLPERLHITSIGNVGIGTNTPAYKLDVCGTIRAKEVKVDLQGNCGADFVFKSDYKLMDLKELETFVKTNQHLPEIASEKEMVENGVNIKDLQIKLLQKMEEMTLYIIKQNKRIEKLENENIELKKK